MESELTRDAKYLLCSIYKNYKEDIKAGVAKLDAKVLRSNTQIASRNMAEWSLADVDETIRELGRASFLSVSYADNIPYFVQLNDAAIVYMENRFKNGVKQVIEHMSSLKRIIFS